MLVKWTPGRYHSPKYYRNIEPRSPVRGRYDISSVQVWYLINVLSVLPSCCIQCRFISDHQLSSVYNTSPQRRLWRVRGRRLIEEYLHERKHPFFFLVSFLLFCNISSLNIIIQSPIYENQEWFKQFYDAAEVCQNDLQLMMTISLPPWNLFILKHCHNHPTASN